MIKPLRANVLINLGKTIGLHSDIIVIPDTSKGINVKGKVVAMGKDCRVPIKVGSKVLINAVKNGDRLWWPRQSKDMGLSEDWHVMAHESKVALSME